MAHEEFYEIFQEEGCDLIQSLTNHLVAMARGAAPDGAMRDCLRFTHTLKGSAGMVGLPTFGRASHHLEDYLTRIRDRGTPPSAGEVDACLKCLQRLRDVLQGEIVAAKNADAAFLTAPLRASSSVGVAKGGVGVAEGSGAAGRHREAGDRGEPDAPGKGSPSRAGQPAPEPSGDTTPAHASATRVFARVPIERLDRLSVFASELAMHSRRLERVELMARMAEAANQSLLQSLRVRRSASAFNPAALHQGLKQHGGRLAALRAELGALSWDVETTVTALGEEIMQARLAPFSELFDRLPGTIWELSRRFDKECEFETEGEDILFDKSLQEPLFELLIHLTTNALHHGIERVDERVRAGKSPSGTIRLSASPFGEMIKVVFSDDGRGIDVVAVRRTAVARGLATTDELAGRSLQEVLNMIFLPGLSTARLVTEVAGRGIGLDIVKRRVEEMKGKVRLRSERGRGTTFEVFVPLTFAINRMFVFRVGGERFAVPMSAVRRSYLVQDASVQRLDGRAVATLGGVTVPLARVAGIASGPTQAGGALTVVVIEVSAGELLGLCVTELLPEHEGVIRPIGVAANAQVANATLLEDGAAVPILNVEAAREWTVPLNDVERTEVSSTSEVEQHAGQEVRVLVVDDAPQMRSLLISILSAAGYTADGAGGGVAALLRLRKRAYHAVVTDIDMPNMDGFELTRAIRGDAKLRDLPVVLVTALESEQHKRRGVEVGANAYLTKSHFRRDDLLETLALLARVPTR